MQSNEKAQMFITKYGKIITIILAIDSYYYCATGVCVHIHRLQTLTAKITTPSTQLARRASRPGHSIPSFIQIRCTMRDDAAVNGSKKRMLALFKRISVLLWLWRVSHIRIYIWTMIGRYRWISRVFICTQIVCVLSLNAHYYLITRFNQFRVESSTALFFLTLIGLFNRIMFAQNCVKLDFQKQ